MGGQASPLHIVHVDPVKPELPVEAAILDAAGVRFTVQRCTTDDEVVELARTADAMLCLAYPLTATVLEQCAQLRVIVRYGIGTDNIDLDAATRLGIAVSNVPDYCIDEVANHTMALLLALNRKLVAQNLGLRSDTTVPLRPMGALRDEILGLIGFGRLARAVAERARAFGLRIVAHDPFLTGPLPPDVTFMGLDQVLSESDYLSIHLPLTPQTRGLIDRRSLSRMKATSYLINTSRGGIIDEHALDEAIRTGVIAGAGLDVWSVEPVSNSNPLVMNEKVIATPHTAFYSDQSLVTLRRHVVENALAILGGVDMSSVVNREVLDQLRPVRS